MSDWLPFLAQIILAQALGLGLAWKIDAASWEHRPAANAVSPSHFISVIVLFATAVYLFLGNSSRAIFVWFGPSALWLLVVSRVQKRQLNVTWRTAFLERLFNSVVFASHYWAVASFSSSSGF